MRIIEVMVILFLFHMVALDSNFYEDGYRFYLSLGVPEHRAREYIADDFDMFFDSDYRPKDFSYYNMIR